MKHIIISDTHAPICIEKPLKYAKELLKKDKYDAIVINGDLLGVFSMTGSCEHKYKGMTNEDIMGYLKSCAPKFTKKILETKELTREMVIEYAKERYEWCFDVIKRFADLNMTIFNMGNHESPHHFLVLHELPFLTGCSTSFVHQVGDEELQPIFENFEKKLYELEKTHDFKYIRDDVYVQGTTLIMGIPGESHEGTSTAHAALEQEKQTQKLIEKAKEHLPYVFSIVIYNHTQGEYDRANAHHQTASPSLKKFIEELPLNISKKVFVQSHNHWSHTQFIEIEGVHYILNNAGLHDGIFNILDIAGVVRCFDVDPNHKKVVPVKLAHPKPVESKEELILRFYDDVDYVLSRNKK